MKSNKEFNTIVFIKQQQIFKMEKSLCSNAFKEVLYKKFCFAVGAFKGTIFEGSKKQ